MSLSPTIDLLHEQLRNIDAAAAKSSAVLTMPALIRAFVSNAAAILTDHDNRLRDLDDLRQRIVTLERARPMFGDVL